MRAEQAPPRPVNSGATSATYLQSYASSSASQGLRRSPSGCLCLPQVNINIVEQSMHLRYGHHEDTQVTVGAQVPRMKGVEALKCCEYTSMSTDRSLLMLLIVRRSPPARGKSRPAIRSTISGGGGGG